MRNSCKYLLQMIYNHSQTVATPLQINSDGSDSNSDSSTLWNDINYLKTNGYVIEPISILRSYTLALTEKGERFVENGFQSLETYPSIKEATTQNIFHIENASNSVIGTQSHVTLHINDAVQQAGEQINSSNSNEKEELQKIIDILEKVVTNQLPAKKGLLSNSLNLIQKNSWIASPITSILLNWLTN